MDTAEMEALRRSLALLRQDRPSMQMQRLALAVFMRSPKRVADCVTLLGSQNPVGRSSRLREASPQAR